MIRFGRKKMVSVWTYLKVGLYWIDTNQNHIHASDFLRNLIEIHSVVEAGGQIDATFTFYVHFVYLCQFKLHMQGCIQKFPD